MIIILSDNSPSSNIGAARFSPTQGSFHSVQLIGAGTHQVQGCAVDILQPVSCKTVLRQSPTGSCHDFAAGNQQWSICFVAGNSLVCSSILLLFSASGKTDTGSSPSTVHLCRWCKHTMILKMVITCIICIICIICSMYLFFCFGIMAEVDWIPDFIRAWPQKASTLCCPCRSYPGKTSSCASWWNRNNSAPAAQLVSRSTWQQQAGCWQWMKDVFCQLMGNHLESYTPVQDRAKLYVPVRTGTYQYIPVHISTGFL
jgi:hypothetical protein